MKDARIQYACYGALFGLAFPIIATLFDALMRDMGFGFAELIEVQKTQPLHWIIDTAPLFLGIFAALAGAKQQEVVEANHGLEKKVEKRTEMLNEQNEELRSMQEELEDSLSRISQSINYAQRIQEAIISNTQELHQSFPDSFVLFKPRDVVSGDFPWYLRKGKYHFVAAVDCTGHGVPGAFMSLIGYFLLNRIVKENEVTDTAEILTKLHESIVNVLNQSSDSDVHDGMDLALCRIDEETKEIMYSGAGNPVYHVSGNQLAEYKADYWSIGGTEYKRRGAYKSQSFSYAKGDSISMFSDGITDQFASDGETKFGFKKIQKQLVSDSAKPMKEVGESFEKSISGFMAGHRQIDDMLLMGVRL
ncbi:MAG: PP2C family protein-serine/threonine phosphatase [Flavobacteriales bacterium]